jgi:RNA polymerase primary sigma factor
VFTPRLQFRKAELRHPLVLTSGQNAARDRQRATREELAEELMMPLDKMREVLKIAKAPLSIKTPIGDFSMNECSRGP